jgi:hypothetical protein
MTRTHQDIPAGRIQPSQFDTVLPPDARRELGSHPKRPRIKSQPKMASTPEGARRRNFRWLPLAAILISLIALGLALRPQFEGRPPNKVTTSLPALAQVQKPAPQGPAARQGRLKTSPSS